MSHSRYALVLATSAAIGITSAPLLAQSPVALSENQQEVLFKQPGYSPYVGRNYPTQVFWGDQHVSLRLVGGCRNVGYAADTRGCGALLG